MNDGGAKAIEDDLDDIDFENEDEAADKVKNQGKGAEPLYSIESTLLMGSRAHKELLELFTQNLFRSLTKKYQTNLEAMSPSGLEADLAMMSMDPMADMLPKMPQKTAE